MKQLVVMIAVASMVFLGQGCSKVGSAKKELKKSISSLKKEIKGSDYYVSLDSLSYDIQKSSSLVNPYMGVIEFVYTHRVSPEVAKSYADTVVRMAKEMGKKVVPEPTSLQKSYEDGVIRYKYRIALLFQNNKWIIDEAKCTEQIWHEGDADTYPDKEKYLDKIYEDDDLKTCGVEWGHDQETLNKWLSLD